MRHLKTQFSASNLGQNVLAELGTRLQQSKPKHQMILNNEVQNQLALKTNQRRSKGIYGKVGTEQLMVTVEKIREIKK